jgi:hypothetical protein
MSSNGEKPEDMSTRWIDTIKNCVTQQTEQRRGLFRDYRSRAFEFSQILDISFSNSSFFLAEMKQRSASLDHSAHAHRRNLQHRATVSIRTP